MHLLCLIAEKIFDNVSFKDDRKILTCLYYDLSNHIQPAILSLLYCRIDSLFKNVLTSKFIINPSYFTTQIKKD